MLAVKEWLGTAASLHLQEQGEGDQSLILCWVLGSSHRQKDLGGGGGQTPQFVLRGKPEAVPLLQKSPGLGPSAACLVWGGLCCRDPPVVNNPELVCDGCLLPGSLSPESYITPLPAARL